MTYFMNPKVTVTFMVVLAYFMTPKGHMVLRGRHDLLYDRNLFGRFDGPTSSPINTSHNITFIFSKYFIVRLRRYKLMYINVIENQASMFTCTYEKKKKQEKKEEI